ncbi:YgfZ/GcvT domain-containing protein [Tahibacter amnicola]|uniref:Folate-binding protein n=1 Tax=Tahibacter amnicola TaxID=2976241 RepID=A0ABY6BC56_9GAMM|nr:folate-binding protein [Tahibacter amnicola]UXI66695.1 folate-binding protein [Tahibacter amnicola]
MIALPAPEVVELAGPDAQKFAQAQFCNDVLALAPGNSQLNGWLTTQGRVRRLFHLYCWDESRYWLVMRGGDAASIVTPLKMFVFRLKVQVAVVSGWRLWGSAEGAAPAGAASIPLPDGRYLHLAPDCTDSAPPASAPAAWTCADIEHGLPWLPEHAIEQVLPSWMGFQALGAISHRKGCYPGQEIVARLHFKGGADKRGPAVVRARPDVLATAGTLRDAQGGEAGILLQHAHEGGSAIGLAVLRRDVAQSGAVVFADGGAPIEVLGPPKLPGTAAETATT